KARPSVRNNASSLALVAWYSCTLACPWAAACWAEAAALAAASLALSMNPMSRAFLAGSCHRSERAPPATMGRPRWQGGRMTDRLRELLSLPSTTLFDIDDDANLLVGNDASGTTQLVEITAAGEWR